MTTLNDLNGYLDDEAYTVRVGELRALLSASIADTAGAKPVTGPWPTDAMNAAGMRELAAFHKSRGDTVDAIYLAMSAAAPPAPSVADAAGASEHPAFKLLAALIDIHDDGTNNAPEHRCYVEGAWNDVMDEARAYVAKESGND